MDSGNKKKLKPNKSSIVRIIISNFDDKQIKEIKVLYSKQGGVDVIRLNGTEPDEKGRIKFNFKSASNRLEDEQTYSLGENDGQTFFVTTNEDETELCVTKRSKFTNEIIKEYRLFGEYVATNSNEKKVIVSVSDDIDYSGEKYQNSQRKNKRTINQSTNRMLLDLDVINNYRQIGSESDKIDKNVIIDSKEIYKINKFLNYRSDMIIYYQIINNFLMQGSAKRDDFENEIWKYVKSTDSKTKKKFLNELRVEYLPEDCRKRLKELKTLNFIEEGRNIILAGSELLFTFLSLRAERKSTIITTNLSFDRWNEIFNDPVLTAALIDRLTHKSYVINMNGDSYRIKETREWLEETN